MRRIYPMQINLAISTTIGIGVGTRRRSRGTSRSRGTRRVSKVSTGRAMGEYCRGSLAMSNTGRNRLPWGNPIRSSKQTFDSFVILTQPTIFQFRQFWVASSISQDLTKLHPLICCPHPISLSLTLIIFFSFFPLSTPSVFPQSTFSYPLFLIPLISIFFISLQLLFAGSILPNSPAMSYAQNLDR